MIPNSTIGNRFMFTGREYLAEINLYDYRNRTYSAELGRFLEPDPLGFAAGDENMYRYVGNNPVNKTDPTGLKVGDPNVPYRYAGTRDAYGGRQYISVNTGYIPTGSHIGERVRIYDDGEVVSSSFGDLGNIYARDAARRVYDDHTGGRLNELGIPYEGKDGFGAALYRYEGLNVLAFRGTNLTSGDDWLASISQAFGIRTSQYTQAIVLGSRVFDALKGDVLFAGHSLGGGLASAAAVATGGDAITFNAAGLSSFTVSGKPGSIRAHYIRGEILSVIQDSIPLPNAAGTRISHKSTRHWDPIGRHYMDNFF